MGSGNDPDAVTEHEMFTAIDIETTGLSAQDEVTVVGFANDEAYDVRFQYPSGVTNIDGFEWESNDRDLRLHGYDSEELLLMGLESALDDLGLKTEGQLLVGFNADGFDYPMLRTRMMIHGLGWPFRGCQCLDIQGPFKYDFSTTAFDIRGFNKGPLKEFGEHVGADVKSSWLKSEIHESVEDNGYETGDVMEFARENGKETPTKSLRSLDEIHSLYVELGILDEKPYDPLGGKSKLCCEKWASGDIEDIIAHNLSDLKMTMDLVELVPEYVHDSELRMTRL